MNKILHPNGLYLMGADMHSDSCVAKIFFESEEEIKQYLEYRLKKKVPEKYEVVELENKDSVKIFIYCFVGEVSKKTPIQLGPKIDN